MDIVEKINYLIKEKGLTKKEFATRLQALEPKLKSTGNIPNLQTIYGYLNGKRELKVELIPYIADVLNVPEQELFSSKLEFINDYDIRYSKESREILELLNYAPKKLKSDIIEILQTLKDTYETKIEQLKKNGGGNPTSF